ncbi:hypothetical protein H109_03159 [Trichophyton interdigitale MR816]|uniref:Brix domain-containing protein n=1 Tax=Trichophyton interdigitale (strain MR816) TaxID=1215338 RepID=A0A059JB06_TRIIM|nr:hypothetical protein H109_03159 [Trichophyton interdigitale MR816]
MGKSSGPRPSGMDYKPRNKLKRQELHIKRKQTKDAETRTLRFARRKEEAKNPQLKAERLKKNVPLTLERKRVWDDAGSDVEDGLGLSFDVERIKRRRQEAEQDKDDLIPDDKEDSEDGDGDADEGGDGSDDDVDSMIDFDSDEGDEQDEEDKKPAEKDRRKKNKVPSATERATSPTQSTRSTNIDLAPDALAAKFPSLFPTEAPPPPKILITTSLNSTLHKEAKVLTEFFPNSVYIRRSAHRYGHKFSVREISSFAANRNYTAVVVLEEDLKRVSGLTIVHLPVGPTFHFSISNWIEGKKLPGHGNPTSHWPELILNNFRTPLGLLTAHLFRTLFPPQPEFQGRQVVTLHNQRDYIFVRRHRYVFRDKRETEKCVVDANGVEMKGVEGIRAGLQELGPRFTLKLRRIDKGIQRKSGQDWEWKGRMEKVRTKFQL